MTDDRDYDALAAKLAEVEAERDQADKLIADVFADAASNNIRLAEASHRAEAAEAAVPAVYRLGLEAAARRVEARAAGNPLHVGQYANSAFVIRRLPTPTATELMARIQTGEKE